MVIQDADTEYSPEEFPELIELICQGRADVVYGSRFLGRHRVFLFTHYLGNLFLTFLTNVLYNTMLTDMETCYKAMRVEVLRSFTLDSDGFRHRARDDGEDLQARVSRLRSADHLRRPRLRRGQEDYLARRRRRALGSAEVSLYRVNSFFRLLRYAKPYKGRLAWAVLAMVVYAVASALVIYLITPILDASCRIARACARSRWRSSALYFVKGIGSYFSGYLMEDVGQRVVMDLRDRLYGHILGQSASFFARNTTGQLLSRVSNDVGAGAACGVGDRGRPAARIARARRLRRHSVLDRLRGWRSSA